MEIPLWDPDKTKVGNKKTANPKVRRLGGVINI
jgi:hypothetical protein